jgi:uncharacterized membrane protein YqiK
MSEGIFLTLVIIGIVVIVVFAFLLWLSRLYVKAPPTERLCAWEAGVRNRRSL